MSKTYPLSEVQQIMIKRGRATQWAGGCGGGCAALCLLIVLTNDESSSGYTTGELALSSALWVGIFYGAGYLIGTLTDDWTPVYMAQRRAYNPPGPLNPQMASDPTQSGSQIFRYGMSF